MNLNKNNIDLLTLFLLFSTGFVFGLALLMNTEKSVRITEVKDLKGGDYLHLIYIGSSGCGYCNEKLHKNIVVLKNKLELLSEKTELNFISTGIAVDSNSDTGYNFLKASGYFDEIITGLTWYNSGTMKYIWSINEIKGKIPSIIIAKSEFNVSSYSGEILDIDHDIEEGFEKPVVVL